MNLMILFGQRKEFYHGEYAPEPLLVWTEYEVDDNPVGFETAVAASKEENKGHMVAMRVINVTVPQEKIRSLLVGTPTVMGIVGAAGE